MNVFVKYRILLVIENSRSYTGIGTFVYEYLGYEQDRDPDSRSKHKLHSPDFPAHPYHPETALIRLIDKWMLWG